MSRFNGPQRKGATRDVRDEKRREAEERNAKTPLERTRQYRRSLAILGRQTG